MARIEVPELTQVLGQLSNASVVFVDDVRTAVQLSTGLLQNVSLAISGAIMELSSTIKGVNSVVPGAISDTSGSVQKSIDLNSPAIHFALITLGIFFIASALFCLFGAVYKGLKAAKFVVDWCKKPNTTANRTTRLQGSSDEKQRLTEIL